MIWLITICVCLLLFAAVAVLVIRNLIVAIFAYSFVLLLLSLLFALLQAPNLALAEIILGAGFSTLLLVLVTVKIHLLEEQASNATHR